MHRAGDTAHGLRPEDTFSGISLPRQAHRIKALISRTQARTILDYGCGKGSQYWPTPITQQGVVRWNSIQEYWGVESIHCYDPAYEPFSTLPDASVDGVICTDVLEHCPEADLEWIVEALFTLGRKFVFANIACFPAEKSLPNGENAHCTIRLPEFWQSLFARAAARFPDALWELWIEEIHGRELSETRSANFEHEQKPSAVPAARAQG